MTYVRGNPKTKKALKDALTRGQSMYAFEPGMGRLPDGGGWISIEGPHYPEPHRWYARVLVDATGKIVSIK